MAQGTIAPFPKHQIFDNNGAPAVGYQLFCYAAGSTTKLDTYQNSALSSLNTNPIVLDAAGRATIFLSPASYKFVLASPTDTDPPASPIWTVDNVSATPPFNVNVDIPGTAGEDLTAGNAVYLSAGDGARTAGRWYKTDTNLAYASSTAVAIGMVPADIATGDSGSIRLSGQITGLAGLTIASIYYLSSTAGGISTSASATNPRAIAQADSASSLVLGPSIPTAYAATSTVPGIVSTIAQTIAGAKTFANAMVCSSTLAVTGQATFTLPPQFYPATVGTSGTVCTASGVIYTDVTAHTTSASGTETTLSSFTIKANSLAIGKLLRVTFFGKFAATGNAKRVRFYFGTSPGTNIFDWGAGVTNNDECWAVEALIYVTTATANIARTKASIGGGHNTANDASVTTTATSFDNVAGDITTDLFIKSTAEDAVAAAGTTQQGFLVEVVG